MGGGVALILMDGEATKSGGWECTVGGGNSIGEGLEKKSSGWGQITRALECQCQGSGHHRAVPRDGKQWMRCARNRERQRGGPLSFTRRPSQAGWPQGCVLRAGLMCGH